VENQLPLDLWSKQLVCEGEQSPSSFDYCRR
jgi:hypothetical protein